MPCSVRFAWNASIASGLWFVARHIRGLCVNTCTQSPPIAAIRSIAVSMPPDDDMCAPNSTAAYDRDAMSVKVRMAPSPTGFLHIGGVRTFLFNWLFARQNGGEIGRPTETPDTSREVAEATEQIQESLRWLGIDWDGKVRFQLDTAARAVELAHQLMEQGHAYEEEGAIRFRQPTDGVVSWEDAVRGHIE